MDANELRNKFYRFFIAHGHARLPSAPLMPENDPTALFISAGMQPLIPYLLGEPHPQGTRLVNVQKCLRTQDIEAVGDLTHLTFFEMLGNWSLGDYFKEESLAWSYEFLTHELGIGTNRLAVTVFAGDVHAPRDDLSAGIWRKLGLPPDRIYFLPREDNWWGPIGNLGPCGPDSEIFFDTGRPDHPGCRPGCSCGKWFEIWNNVFMEYNQLPGGYEKLPRPNVDTGMGVERTIAVLQGHADIFEIETLKPLVARLEDMTGCSYSENPRPFRVIADHLRAATFAINDGALPSNVEAGYVVRRLIRRAVRFGWELEMRENFCAGFSGKVVELFGEVYPDLEREDSRVIAAIGREETKFKRTLERGLREYYKVQARIRSQGRRLIPAEEAFNLFETFGLPLELTVELADEVGLEVDQAGYRKLFQEHRQVSRRSIAGKFKGGLADHTEAVTRLHTATHLLHAALREVLGDEVRQMGSNITSERLRFEFSYSQALTPEQVREVESLVNQQIEDDLPVSMEVVPLERALKGGALAFFGEKYGDPVKVYSIGSFSKEVCGGPHVSHTAELGQFQILKQEAVGQGVRRLRAVLKQPGG